MTSEAVVHLVDDDEGVRHSLAFLLTTAGLAVRVHLSASAFMAALATLQPGCVVSDIRMPEIDGLELQRRLKTLELNLPVILMTGHGDIALAVQAMKAGAVDFIEKPFDDERMLSAIRLALDRHDRAGARRTEILAIQARLQSLSLRERQVLDGLLGGHANKAIAHDLGLSARTVEVHRANIMTKMDAASLSLLVRKALMAGALPAA